MTYMGSKDMLKTIEIMKSVMEENRERLIELDSAMGDGDLGIYVVKGMEKAWEMVNNRNDLLPAEILKKTGMAYFTEAPSTMGTLLSTAFIQAGKALNGKERLNGEDLVNMYRAFAEGIRFRGGAKPGEKTILDVLIPAQTAAEEACAGGEDLIGIANAAYKAAAGGMENAKQMKAVHGRPAYFGEKTVGLYDGGTVVGMLLCQAVWKALAI